MMGSRHLREERQERELRAAQEIADRYGRSKEQGGRMTASIDIDGDVIEAEARDVGDRAYAKTKNGSIAAMAAARKLAQLRTWVDPFSPAPESGYLAGRPQERPEA